MRKYLEQCDEKRRERSWKGGRIIRSFNDAIVSWFEIVRIVADWKAKGCEWNFPPGMITFYEKNISSFSHQSQLNFPQSFERIFHHDKRSFNNKITVIKKLLWIALRQQSHAWSKQSTKPSSYLCNFPLFCFNKIFHCCAFSRRSKNFLHINVSSSSTIQVIAL